jgi:hypothetical protein
MKIEFTPLTGALVPACRAFNSRLRLHGEPLFVLPEEAPPPEPPAAPGGIARTQYVAVDETGAVRGGVLLVEQRGWLAGREIALVNVQSPLTEGIVDRAFAGVGFQMLRFIARRGEFAYAVGMGSDQKPFPRLLKAAGWSVSLVPFQFAVIQAAPVLRELAPVRQGHRRTLARLAAATGLGAAAATAWRAAHPNPPLRGYSLEQAAFEPGHLDLAWARCREAFTFAAARDAQAVESLHPATQPRLRRFVLRRGGEPLGWSAGLVTEMRDNPHFGNLTVATILDALAPGDHLPALLALTRDALADLGAALVIANNTHARWREVCRRLGFLSAPSNYVLGLSKPLAAVLQSLPEGLSRAYVTRADGDGRLHL